MKARFTLVHRSLRKELHKLHQSSRELHEKFDRQAEKAAQANEEQKIYRDVKEVLDRVGISARTLLRFQKMGLINVITRFKGKKYYLDSDLERFRKFYHRIGP